MTDDEAHITSWPKRRWLCISCRTATTELDACGCGAPQSLQFGDIDERTALIRSVWRHAADPELLPQPAPPPTPRIIIFIGLITALLLIGSQLFASIQLAFAAAMTLLMLPLVLRPQNPLGTAGRRMLARPPGVVPIGAATNLPALVGASRIAGTVRATHQDLSPLRSEPCVAFAIELENVGADRSARVLHDGATLGFTVGTDAGDTVVIPAGSIDIVNGYERADEFASRLYLAFLDPLAESAEGPDPFPFEAALETVVRDGDRVWLHNSVHLAPDPSAIPLSYREAAGSLLTPVGTPRIELDVKPSAAPADASAERLEA